MDNAPSGMATNHPPPSPLETLNAGTPSASAGTQPSAMPSVKGSLTLSTESPGHPVRILRDGLAQLIAHNAPAECVASIAETLGSQTHD